MKTAKGGHKGRGRKAEALGLLLPEGGVMSENLKSVGKLTEDQLRALKASIPAANYRRIEAAIKGEKPATQKPALVRNTSTGEMEDAEALKRRLVWKRENPRSSGKPGTVEWSHDVVYRTRLTCGHLTADQIRPFMKRARKKLGLDREKMVVNRLLAVECTIDGQRAFVRMDEILHGKSGAPIWVITPTEVTDSKVEGPATLREVTKIEVTA